jgi:hypothetical protein
VDTVPITWSTASSKVAAVRLGGRFKASQRPRTGPSRPIGACAARQSGVVAAAERDSPPSLLR